MLACFGSTYSNSFSLRFSICRCSVINLQDAYTVKKNTSDQKIHDTVWLYFLVNFNYLFKQVITLKDTYVTMSLFTKMKIIRTC
jgi:hypothetical protein